MFEKIPQYNGTESENEDIVYHFFRLALNERGYSFRVKHTGYSDIDGIIPSATRGAIGKGLCDGYFFNGDKAESFYGMIELESTGKLTAGIEQIQTYAKGFRSKRLSAEQKEFVKNIANRNIILLVFDGQLIYLSRYSLDTGSESILINKEPLEDSRHHNNAKVISQFPEKSLISRNADEKHLVKEIARLIRGHDKIQKNKAFIMTVLASIYGQTKDFDIDIAVKHLKSSQLQYDKTLSEMWNELCLVIGDDTKYINVLYKTCAANLYEISQDRGMDLYGFIYEELATKDSKKEQGEYYTPRHTIRPLIKAVFDNYLKWSQEELSNKVIVDPFCGSGGFLYEFINLMRKKFSLKEHEVNNITQKVIYGFDKNDVFSAQLNMYLVGDGKTNIRKVNTTLNWRNHFLYKPKHSNKKYDVQFIDEIDLVKKKITENIEDINSFIKVYANRDIEIEIESLTDLLKQNSYASDNLITSFLLKKMDLSNSDYLGNTDLLMTNVPYGKVTDATEQIIENGEKLYGNSLEANALRECIDFLRPGVMKGQKKISEGGIAIIIIPDAILENPTNKNIRDYMFARCDIIGIVSLPLYTFSPYAMEKSYAIVIQKLAPEEFSYSRTSNIKTFMYMSLCDGRANSINRYATNMITEIAVHDIDGKLKKVSEFLHNDFDPCFECYNNELYYQSKLERAWNYKTFTTDPDWDQKRIYDTWNGQSWDYQQGRKWGFFVLEKIKRKTKKKFSNKQILNALSDICAGLDETEKADLLNDVNSLKKQIENDCSLSSSDLSKLLTIDGFDLENGNIIPYKYEIIEDLDMNIDSVRYLGAKKEAVQLDNIANDITTCTSISSPDDIIDYFSREITSSHLKVIRIMDEFIVDQGTQFSKEDAYKYPGRIPVYTAQTDGPAYFVSENIPGKTMLEGRTLIWSRKGAKAGTIQIIDSEGYFYISDVSGTIMPKDQKKEYDFIFLKYYIQGQLSKEKQSASNNAQINKSRVENLQIYIPNIDIQKKIGNAIRKRLSNF